MATANFARHKKGPAPAESPAGPSRRDYNLVGGHCWDSFPLGHSGATRRSCRIADRQIVTRDRNHSLLGQPGPIRECAAFDTRGVRLVRSIHRIRPEIRDAPLNDRLVFSSAVPLSRTTVRADGAKGDPFGAQ